MAVFLLDERLVFPPAELAEPGGLLAVGGDLRPERLELAYRKGIFPWYSEAQPILWHSPDPRFVLYPERLKVSRSLRSLLRRGRFRVSFDSAFERVVEGCAVIPRPGQAGTWIVEEMKEAYLALHRRGLAHSVEVWDGAELVGGLYGVAIGAVFFGESMFSRVSNSSKVGFATLVPWLLERGVRLIDCQVYTRHLESLGAEQLARRGFLALLDELVRVPTGLVGSWRGAPERAPGEQTAKSADD